MTRLFSLIIYFSCLTILLHAEYTVSVISEDTGSETGVAEVIADGRTGPYNVSILSFFSIPDKIIDLGSTSVTYSNLSVGTYTAVITNAYGCIVEVPFEISACALEVNFYLEGPYDLNAGSMNTRLYERGLLPGQTPESFFYIGTPPGQPYNTSPWSYPGTEGENWSDIEYDLYDESPVDWALLTVLDSDLSNYTTHFTSAGVLTKYGNFHFTCPSSLRDILGIGEDEDFYVKIEHRNHLGMMTADPIHFQNSNDNLIADFRNTDSFKDPTSVGQIELVPGVWAMISGDMDQNELPSYDINGADKIIWKTENGTFDNYLGGDMNLNGDVNGEDKIKWKNNNGTTSRVPKN